jgi:hypothetical protein
VVEKRSKLLKRPESAYTKNHNTAMNNHFFHTKRGSKPSLDYQDEFTKIYGDNFPENLNPESETNGKPNFIEFLKNS